MLHSKDLFSSQIYYKPLRSKKLNSELKKECYQIHKADEEGQIWSQKNYLNGFTSYGSNQSGFDRLHNFSSTFGLLKKKIDSHVQNYIEVLDYDITIQDLYMTHCWVNIMGPYAHHSSHIHPLSVISGTYYVSTPADASCLRFEDPRLGLMMNTPAIKKNCLLKNKRIIDLHPKSEHVVLFESWMKHEVTLSTSKKDRVSISFNYGWSSI